MSSDLTLTVPIGAFLYWYGVFALPLGVALTVFRATYIRCSITPVTNLTAFYILDSWVKLTLLWPLGLWEAVDFYRRNEPYRRKEVARRR